MLLGLLATAACTAAPPPEPPPLYRVSDGAIVDRDGAALWLHAINVHGASKTAADHLVPLDDGEIALLAASGFSAVRLLSFWEAIMPTRGSTDDDYLRRYAAEVDRLAAAGFYVVIDMHQDLWGQPFGDGAPDWACADEVKAGYTATQPWWLNYLSPQVSGCFDGLWTDASLRADFVAAWQALAGRVCHGERVVGFDLLNEPYPGSSLGVRHFDQSVLYQRLYRPLMDAIDQVCPGRLFFLEPSRTYDLDLVDAFALDAADRERAVVAPHFYPSQVHEAGAGYDGDTAALADRFDHLYRGWLDQGHALWIGEYGGLTDNPNYDRYLTDFTALTASAGITGALWEFKRGAGGLNFLDDDGQRKRVFDPLCGLPQPVRLPDSPFAVGFDFEAPALALEVECHAGQPLELQLPPGTWRLEQAPSSTLLAAPLTGQRLITACTADTALRLTVAPAP